tara:strand:- start:870 stop:1313 length:444 start_codon:yes stop_codon:yes gene_type:complete
MIKWSKFATKAKFYASEGASKIGLGVKERFKLSMKYQKAKKKLSNKAFDIKKGAMKLTEKMKPSPESVLAARAKMQVGIRSATAKVQDLKKNPTARGFGKGFKIGTFAVGGVAVGSGAYNLATGQRQVRVKKQTAKELKELKKLYKI